MNLSGCLHYSLLAGYEAILPILFSAFYRMDHRPKKKLIYLFLALGVMAFLTMFRDGSVGNDTANYIAMFRRVSYSDPIAYIRNSITEPGFLCYVWVLTQISSNPQILLIVSGLFIYLSIGRFLYKYVEAPGVVCFAMVTLMKFDFFMSAERQALSIAILLWSYGFLIEKKAIKFLIVSLIAVSFHYSSIMFIVTYFLLYSKLLQSIKLDKKFYIKWILGLTTVMLFFQGILDVLLSLFPKYAYYKGTILLDGEPRLALILQGLVAITLFVTSMALISYEDKVKINNRILAFFSIVNISLVLIATNATALNRLCATYTLFPIMQYSVALSSYKAMYRSNHLILLLLTLFFFFLYGFIIVALRTPEWYTTYPYKFM